MDLWIIAYATPFFGILVGGALSVVHVRWANLQQLRCWAREDGLTITDRAQLKAHYRGRQLW
jgi:hypothetical protein